MLGASALALAALAVRRASALRALALLLALAAGALGLAARLDAAARHRPGAPREALLEATVRHVERRVSWFRLELADARAVGPAARPVPGRLQLVGGPTPPGWPAVEAALPGERLRLAARLRAPGALRNPGASLRTRDLARRGVGARARLVHPALHVRLESGRRRPLVALERRRARAAGRLVEAGPGGGLLAALAFGDRRGLGEAEREAFARLGLSHLLAVSGLHLGLVAGALFALARAVLSRSAALAARRDVRPLALAAALAGAAGYALLSGWGVPVRRAWVLLLATGLAVACARPGARAEPLAVASLAILAAQPQALFAPGAQLSFAASAALVASLAPREPGAPAAFARPRRALGRLLGTSASAIAATAPLAAFHFGRAAPLALVANLAAVPWTALVLLPAALVAAAGAAAPGVPGAELALAVAEGIARATLQGLDASAAALPAPAPGARPAGAWLLAASILVPFALRTRSTARRVALAAAIGAALAVAPPRALAPPPPRAVVLEVGQGDASVVQGRSGAVLIDAGPAIPGGPDLGRRAVLPALAALGVRHLDALILTHADLDHRGGAPAVLRALPVDVVWIPFGSRGDEGFAPLLAAAAARGVPVVERGRGSRRRRAGDLVLEPLWPPRAASVGARRNDRSLVVAVELGAARLLFPGDLGARAEAALLRSGADVSAHALLLPHHGSRGSASRALLEAVGAEVAVASAPLAGRFGMPHAETLARARRAGLPVWWTGRDGAVVLRLSEPRGAWGLAAGGS